MTRSGRDAYRQTLTSLAATDDRILCLEADLGGRDHPFQAAYPDRFFNLGIAEAAMIDIAAGLAVAGFRPFVSTFAPFAALRAAESIKLALGYLRAGVTVVAPYAGVSGAWFGTTHHCLEDLAVLRAIPGVVVAAPYGEAEMAAVIRSAVASGRPHYVRTGRNATYPSLPWDGGGSPGSPGSPGGSPPPAVNWPATGDRSEVCLVSVGEEGTRLCLEAQQARPDLDLAHAHLCYLDHQHLAAAAAELAGRHRHFVVVEEHRAAGGVAEALALLMPGSVVTGVNAGHGWPSGGGDHAEVMAQLDFDLPAVLAAVSRLPERI